ncbi:carboxypeptidase B-like [Anticarsia gemmatalis]|uniref:carboxypeptidase B-like n=1 Tax=Anticarsia gemmatalis TaxID=129554 RepID=UPI003F7780D6
MARILLVFGIIGCLWQGGYSLKYDNHTLLRFLLKNDAQVEAAHHFHDPEGEVEVLKVGRGVNDTMDFLVPPNKLSFVNEFASSIGLKVEAKKKNYGRSFEDLHDERTPRRRYLKSFNLYEYHSFGQIQEFLNLMAARHPHLLTLQSLGNSYEGRVMKLAKISLNPRAGNPIIFVDAGIHSREWVAPAYALYMIHRLITDPAAVQPGGELDGVDWYILPVANPDGYEFTRTARSNRLWRKTRSKNGHCYGVDGNRNYGFKWAVSGVSKNPCDKETFAGPKPFSEPETRMVRNIMMENSKLMKLYVSLHSYGQYLVYPWGYTGDILPKEWKKLDSMARAVSDSVKRAGGKPFRVLSAGKWYPAAGGSDDFAFGAVGVPYSYTMELTDGYEFLFPETLLREVLPQFYEGFRTFGTHIKKEFGRDRLKWKAADEEE